MQDGRAAGAVISRGYGLTFDGGHVLWPERGVSDGEVAKKPGRLETGDGAGRGAAGHTGGARSDLRKPPHARRRIRTASLAPRECWGFGWSTLEMSFGPGGLNREWFVVGCFAWRVEYDPPLTSSTVRVHRSWWGDGENQ